MSCCSRSFACAWLSCWMIAANGGFATKFLHITKYGSWWLTIRLYVSRHFVGGKSTFTTKQKVLWQVFHVISISSQNCGTHFLPSLSIFPQKNGSNNRPVPVFIGSSSRPQLRLRDFQFTLTLSSLFFRRGEPGETLHFWPEVFRVVTAIVVVNTVNIWKARYSNHYNWMWTPVSYESLS